MSLTRREFITLLGGAAAAWPVTARAQQPTVPVVGVLLPGSAAEWIHNLAALRQGLGDAGFVEGRNIVLETRFSELQFDRLPKLAAELVEQHVAVIVAGTRASRAAKDATTRIPVVFVGGPDPVRTGLVTQLNRPGGNVTGIAGFGAGLSAKRFGLLHDLVPQATVLGYLSSNSGSANDPGFELQEVQIAARNAGVALRVIDVGSESAIEAAFARFASEGTPAVLVAANLLFYNNRERTVAAAAQHGVPAIYEFREYVSAGGLMSFSTNTIESYRQAAGYVARILKGDKPGELPVMLPTRFEFVINLKVAKTLGLTIPPGLLAIADEVIE
jgi:putative ABC transport system substrate-binding protein